MLSVIKPKLHKTREIMVAVITAVVGDSTAVNSSISHRHQFNIYSNVASQNVQGDFTVSSSDGSGIRVCVMDDTNFATWQNRTAFSTYCDNRKATAGNISLSPPAGSYILVFDNTFSATSKNVTADIFSVVMPLD